MEDLGSLSLLSKQVVWLLLGSGPLCFMITKGHFQLSTSKEPTKLIQREMRNLPITNIKDARENILANDKHRNRYQSSAMIRQAPQLPFLNACTVCMKTTP